MQNSLMSLMLSFMLLSATTCSFGSEEQGEILFERLKELKGQWRIAEPARDTKITFEVIANGSALVEKWVMSPTRSSLTVYTLDGDQLLVTHYCPQGNAPRLSFRSQRDDKAYYFEMLDGMNLQQPDASHQHAFWIRFDSADSFSRSEVYIKNGSRYSAEDVKGEPQIFVRVKE